MTFVKGQSGNAAGRRKGSRNKVTELVEGLAGAGAEEMTRRLLSAANAGNMAAMRVYFDRMWPKRRGAPIALEIPPIRSSADLPVALAAICQGLTDGEISPEEFETLSRGVDFMSRSLKAPEIDARLERHEAMLQAMATGIGATFEFAPSTMWQAGEPVGRRPDGVRFADPAGSRDADVASATDLQAGVASATDQQGDEEPQGRHEKAAGATSPLASAADMQGDEGAVSPDGAQRHPGQASRDFAAGNVASVREAVPDPEPLASATDLQGDETAGRSDGGKRGPGMQTPDFGDARLNPGHEATPEGATPPASATDLQGPAADENRTDGPPTDPPPDAQADEKDDAWMREFLGPEYGVPWQGYGERRKERRAA
jgi:hypothetical protein